MGSHRWVYPTARSFNIGLVAVGALATSFLAAREVRPQASASSGRTLLVVEKRANALDIIDPTTLKFIAKVPVGEDPHEVIASADGRMAYVSNYGGERSTLHSIAVVDLMTHRALPAIDLGALRGAHGLDFAGGELYFTVETNKAIGRYDPSTRQVDWVLGTGQDRTHMVWVARSLDKIVTSNVRSATMSIIDQVAPPSGASDPGAGGDQRLWEVTNVPVGRGGEGFDVSPDEREIWTANAEDATVSIIDFATKRVIQTVPISVNGANRLKFTPDGTFVLVSGLGGSGGASAPPDVVVIDAKSRKEIKQLQLGGGAAGMLMDPDGSRAFIAVSGGNKLVALNLRTFTVSGELAPLGNPDGMAWSAPSGR